MIKYLLYNQTDSNKKTAINRQQQTDSNKRDKEPRNTRLNHALIKAARHAIKSRTRTNLVRSSSLTT